MSENVSGPPPREGIARTLAAGFLLLAAVSLVLWQWYLLQIKDAPNRSYSPTELVLVLDSLGNSANILIVLVFIFLMLAIITLLSAIPRTEASG